MKEMVVVQVQTLKVPSEVAAQEISKLGAGLRTLRFSPRISGQITHIHQQHPITLPF
jgi:hypothetical protein